MDAYNIYNPNQAPELAGIWPVSHPGRRMDGHKRRFPGGGFFPVALVGVVLGVALAVAMPRVFSMTLQPSAAPYTEVTVAPGQTLWDIAAAHKAPRTDTRSMVHRIRIANEMADAAVYPGQVLRIPASQTSR